MDGVCRYCGTLGISREHEDSEWAQDVIAVYESDEMKEYMEEHNQEDG